MELVAQFSKELVGRNTQTPLMAAREEQRRDQQNERELLNTEMGLHQGLCLERFGLRKR